MVPRSGTTRSFFTPRRAICAASVVTAVTIGISLAPSAAWAKKSDHHNNAKSKHPTTTTTTKKGKVSASSELKSLSSSLSAFKNGTFKATYTFASGSQSGTITFEQQPPKTLFTFAGATGGGSFINTGTTTYFCSTSTPATCISESSSTNPLASALALFDPSTYQSDLSAAQQALAAKEAGYSVSFSIATIAGQPSKCASVSGPSGSGKYCVTDSGILASVSSTGASFTLNSFSKSVSANDFTPPAGATVETIP